MKLSRWLSLAVLLLVLSAAALRLWAAPFLTRLENNYTSSLKFVVTDQIRTSPAEPWQSSAFNAERIDQTLSSAQGVNIIQSALNWYNPAGGLIFLSTGIYGVDQQTRANIPGYGDTSRSGQFLFPLRLKPQDFTIWDPMFIGPRQAFFERIDTLAGLDVYVYRFTVNGLDETEGYAYLPEVPERYRVQTDGQGTLWVEPVSGIVVACEERGVSAFWDLNSGSKLDDFHIWSDSYSPETQAAQLQLARAMRLRILLLDTWLPAAFLLAALGLLVLAWRKRTRDRSSSSGSNGPAELRP